MSPEPIVIVNPDKFVPRGECEPFPYSGKHARYRRARGSMCEECLYGTHDACEKPDCPCICRDHN